jgi:hypothetical protein
MQAQSDARPRTRFSWLSSEPAVAILTWLVLSTAAVGFVHTVDMNPLTTRGEIVPLAFAAVGGGLLLALAWRSHNALLPAIIAGALAAWVLFMLVQSYHGTPFGDSGLRGDTGRLTAAVTRYTTTWKPVDAFVPSIPIEYPPLFPYVLGHLANVLGRPGWTLVGDGLAVTMSLAVMSSFLLWRRLVSSYVAVVLSLIPLFAFSQPRKAYEILVLALLTPWALSTFNRFREPGGLHWLPAGIVLGLMVQTYLGFPLYDALGLAVLVILGWRRAAVRRDYGRHVVLTLAVAVLVSAWYIGPYLYFALFRGSQRVADYAILGGLMGDPLQTLPFTGGILGGVQLLGLFGLLIMRRQQWWAEPMLVMVAGAFAYRYIYLFGFAANGHTGFLYYTANLTDTMLDSAAVLTVWAGLPVLARRLQPTVVRSIGVVAGALFLAIMMSACWKIWMPSPIGVADKVAHSRVGGANLALLAHAEPLPSGQLPRYGVPRTVTQVGWLPVPLIEAAVRARLGPNANPVTLSYDERLFAYKPWPAYMSVERFATNSLMKWDARYAEVKRLSAISDPVAFADATQHTKFGRIDVFLLRNARAGTYEFLNLPFTASQFGSAWDVIQLPTGPILIIRIPGQS